MALGGDIGFAVPDGCCSFTSSDEAVRKSFDSWDHSRDFGQAQQQVGQKTPIYLESVKLVNIVKPLSNCYIVSFHFEAREMRVML